MTYLWLCLFGVGVGVLSGLLGIGGGIALVPGLILLFGFTQPEAQGTSLAILSLPVAIFAAIVYYQHQHVRLPDVGWVALGFIGGALLGALLVPYIPQQLLRIAFGLALLYVGFLFVLAPSSPRAEAALPAGLATLLSGLVGWVLRRKMLPRPAKRPPPGEDLEYHL